MDPFAPFTIPIVVALLVGLLLMSANPHATTSGGRGTVEYGRSFKRFAIFSGMIAIAPLVGAAFVSPDDQVSLLLISLLFGVPALYLLLEGFGVRVVYSEQGVQAFSPWRKNRLVPWRAISCVSYSPAARWYRIETHGHGFIRLHEMKSGVASLLQELRRRGVNGA